MSKIQERTDVTFSNAKLAFFKKKSFQRNKTGDFTILRRYSY